MENHTTENVLVIAKGITKELKAEIKGINKIRREVETERLKNDLSALRLNELLEQDKEIANQMEKLSKQSRELSEKAKLIAEDDYMWHDSLDGIITRFRNKKLDAVELDNPSTEVIAAKLAAMGEDMHKYSYEELKDLVKDY